MPQKNCWYQDYNFVTFDKIDSTNDEAKRIAKSGLPGDFIIWAKEQTSGRGRFAKKWMSPEGNFYLSILKRHKLSVELSAQISFVIAVALQNSLKDLLPKNAIIKCKWPNDIMVNGKKIAGILLETTLNHNNYFIDWIVIGIGINIINFPEIILSNNISATSLKHENINNGDNQKLIEPEDLLDILLSEFTKLYDIWITSGFKDIREMWLERAYGLGSPIVAQSTGSRLSGIFDGIDNKGAIIMKLTDGKTCVMSTGDMFYEEIL